MAPYLVCQKFSHIHDQILSQGPIFQKITKRAAQSCPDNPTEYKTKEGGKKCESIRFTESDGVKSIWSSNKRKNAQHP